MKEKPGKPGKPTGKAQTEPEHEERQPGAEESPGKEQKRKPGDAARKMREMFKG
ncbi:hypothetical protein [Spirillospora sp. CA-128828]|uniref:hypothetical protein n=1 Tax=Spirillospora sp. CA-128828 TaxID=3240033 RepID=UPI003D926AA2